MSAIITDQLRILNAKNFLAGVASTTNSYYTFVALPNSQDNSSTWNVSPPDPRDNFDQENSYWDTMIALKKITPADVFIKDGFFEQIGNNLSHLKTKKVIDATGKYLLPGVIDDQVHFREPGLTHKATIGTEARAAVAGGTTSFMEMPNTVPNALTQTLLEDKYQIAAQTSVANYSFFMGASNDNYDEAMKTDTKNVCGLKIFMGSSTGNMLVDDKSVLTKIFSNSYRKSFR
jgi:dihydroorotase-like cyclic amidohydrolase